MKPFKLGLAIVLTLAEGVGAEVLRFREGGKTVLPVTEVGPDLLLHTPMGLLRFARTDFLEVLPGGTPETQWPGRRDEARKGGGKALLAAALWALDQGLVAEAEAMVREALASAPQDATTLRLFSYLDRLGPALPDPETEPLLRGLPRSMRVARGPHVLLLHQHTEAEAAERVEHLERVLKAYYLYFGSLGFELSLPDRKIPSAWVAKKADYLAFLRAEGASAFLSTRGYHHPSRGLVVSYDCRDDPERRRAQGQIGARWTDLARLAERVESIPISGRSHIDVGGGSTVFVDRSQARSQLMTFHRRVQIEELQFELSRREIDWAVAAHEMIHQLVAVSGLSPGHDALPGWLHEGLAMQFEAIRGGRWGGLGTPPAHRLSDYLKGSAKFRSINALLRDGGQSHGYHEARYAAAWAFVYYLRIEKNSQFVILLDSMRMPAAERGKTRDLLTQTMGDGRQAEEARWHKAMLDLGSSRD